QERNRGRRELMRRSNRRLTDRSVRALRHGTEARDADVPGFGVRRRASGRTFFFYRYDTPAGRRRLVLGEDPSLTLEQARSRARAARSAVEPGADPAAERAARRRRGTEESFDALAEEYLERHAYRKKRRRSAQEDERQLRKIVLPVWRGRRAADIRRR